MKVSKYDDEYLYKRLYNAMYNGTLLQVRSFLSICGAEEGEVRCYDLANNKNQHGVTMLHFAALYNQSNIAEFLINRQAKVEAKDNNGRTPLFFAILKGNAHVVKVLMDHGAELNTRNHQGDTPLHYAVFYNRAHIAEILIKFGAKPDVKNDQGKTPLDVAILSDDKDMINLLTGNMNIVTTEYVVSTMDNTMEAIISSNTSNGIFDTRGTQFLFINNITTMPSMQDLSTERGACSINFSSNSLVNNTTQSVSNVNNGNAIVIFLAYLFTYACSIFCSNDNSPLSTIGTPQVSQNISIAK